MKNNLCEMLGIDYPILVAPMFLVSNQDMITEALEFGVTAAFPALNYRTEKELREVILQIRDKTNKPFGVNLIVNKSNPKYKGQLKILLETKIDFIITSLGNPEDVIKKCKPLGIKVFCDIIDVKTAQKVEKLGADAVIAVNNKAGGHCGTENQNELIESIKSVCKIPIISAGGIGTSIQLKETLNKGIAGVSIGTVFLASTEAKISSEYQNALIEYGAKDIVLTTKLSGSHLTVINTPYVKSLGTKTQFLERLMNKSKILKKYIKLIIAIKGMKTIENSTFNKATYKTYWCAGPAIENIKSIRPMKEILKNLVNE